MSDFDHSHYAKGLVGYAMGGLILAYERDGLTRKQALAAGIIFLGRLTETLFEQAKAELGEAPPELPPVPTGEAN